MLTNIIVFGDFSSNWATNCRKHRNQWCLKNKLIENFGIWSNYKPKLASRLSHKLPRRIDHSCLRKLLALEPPPHAPSLFPIRIPTSAVLLISQLCYNLNQKLMNQSKRHSKNVFNVVFIIYHLSEEVRNVWQ